MTDIFVKLGYTEINKIINDSEDFIYLSLPSIDNEIAESLLSVIKTKPHLQIQVLIDQSESKLRKGYGDIDSLINLVEKNLSIKNLPNNLVSFIITDKVGYYIFPESRIIEKMGESINSVKLTSIEKANLIANFFPPSTNKEKELLVNQVIENQNESKEISNEIIKSIEQGKTKLQIELLDKAELKKTKENIIINPIKPPDLQREINVYTSKIQYVEIKFEGVNFDEKKVSIPPEALPIQNEEFRNILETKIKLFGQFHNSSSLWEIKAINNKVNRIRKNLTRSISGRSKRVIIISVKEELVNSLDELKNKVSDLKKRVVKLYEKEINKAVSNLRESLKEYLNNSDFPSENLFDDKIEDYTDFIIDQIKFPNPEEFKEKIKLDYHFYDFTWEDLNNDKILEELMSKRVIEKKDFDEIVKIRKAYESQL